jgi:serine/threonine-protein kinase
MAALDPARWAALSPYIDELLTLPPLERNRRIDELAANDPRTAAEVRELMRSRDDASRAAFLDGVADDSVVPAGVQAGEVLGAWTLHDVIGEGGMGSVWRARRSDGRFEGSAAIKLLRSGLFDAAGQQRFRREGAILSRLRHPGIAQLLDAGITPRGQPYLVLELVQGQRIDQWCDAHGLSVRQRVALCVQVLDSVASAHAQLIIHRDLKPSNILVDDSGRVKLLDFGIARLLDEEPGAALTHEGAVALTPQYAAPEQFSGGALSMATDVYALGVVLYELLTGAHPSALPAQASLLEHHRAALRGPALAPSARAPQQRRALRGDLDTLVAKCLAADPAERYPSAAALREDLQRHLSHEPISAHAPGLAYRSLKLLRRRPLESALTAAAVAFLAAGVIGVALFARQAQHSAADALAARDRAAADAQVAREQRDIARAQSQRAEAFNELNTYLMSDAAPSGRPFTVGELLQRSVELLDRQQALAPASRVEMLTSIGFQFANIDDDKRSAVVLERAYALSQQVEDLRVRAGAACALARPLGRTGGLARAEQLVTEQLATLPTRPELMGTRITCLVRASELAIEGDSAPAAVAHAEAARQLLDQMDGASPMLALTVQMALAEAYRHAAQNAQALVVFEDVERRIQLLGRVETETAITLHNNYGLLLSMSGRLLEADRQLGEAIRLGQAFDGDRGVAPILLVNHARVQAALSKGSAALKTVALGLQRARAVNNEVVENQGLLVQTRILRDLGRYAESERVLDTVEGRLRKSLPPGHGAFLAVIEQRARQASARGQVPRAMALIDSGIHTAEADARGAGRSVPLRFARAEIALAAGDAQQARRDAEQLLFSLRAAEAPATASSRIGRTQWLLAQSLSRLGEKAAAAAALDEALRHMVPTMGDTHPDVLAAQRQRAAL